MSISHRDLGHQQGTDASVLDCLLRPENDFYMLTAKENGERRTTHEFLEMIATQWPRIRVLLDVGAQVLDLSNEDVAMAWLSLTSDVAGAIYFDEGDQLMILPKNGTMLPLISSPLAQQLDRCIAYLDHAHTRGTDIKFPKGFRAAVTLGTKVTKDHLVQGLFWFYDHRQILYFVVSRLHANAKARPWSYCHVFCAIRRRPEHSLRSLQERQEHPYHHRRHLTLGRSRNLDRYPATGLPLGTTRHES